MIVDLGIKFTSANFKYIYSKYYEQSFDEKRAVTFNLRKLEWIAIEQITFWFAWVKELQILGVKISIQLPESSLNPAILRRRQFLLYHLLYNWQIKANLNGVEFQDGNIQTEIKQLSEPNPFITIPTQLFNCKSFDQDFENLYTSELQVFTKYAKNLIEKHSDLNYFDNHYLHYSIVKEFYSNVCQHAFSGSKKSGQAYISLKVNTKIDNKFGKKYIQEKLKEKYEERDIEEQPFFYSEEGVPINDSYIEMCFLDLGEGIVTTLKEKYLHQDFSNIQNDLQVNHYIQNEDTRILEYAFLLFTSKFELAERFGIHDYVPRGLFIIKEIVSRYKGMIIATSGKGKVIFDYSKSLDVNKIVRYRQPDADSFFKGTCLTILLPTKKILEKTHYSVERQNESKELKHYPINLLDILIKAGDVNQQDENEKKKTTYDNFFYSLSNRIINKSKDDTIIFIDFAGIEMAYHDILNKVLYFFSYCPLISENSQLLIFNLIDKGLNESLIFSNSSNLKSKGFYPKPIPVIYPDLVITWIGINDKELENKLTEIWMQDTTHYMPTESTAMLFGNVIRVTEIDNKSSQVSLSIPNLWDIGKILLNDISKFLTAEIANNGIEFPSLKSGSHNYNHVQQVKTDENGKFRAFQVANGKYQKKFFSFIEKMYVREYRRGLATYLCTSFHFNKQESTSINRCKVLTVTLSSQLLGKEFVDICNALYEGRANLELVPLSNYYEFYNEEPFNEIKPSDKIIVVNDVISTGNLSQNLYYSIKGKRATLYALLTILDTRVKLERTNNIQLPIISLLDINLEKYTANPYSETTPIRINPILNSPTTMSRSKSGEENILVRPIEFLKYFENDEYFLVGNFQTNTVYHSYYPSTKDLFVYDKKNDFRLMTNIFKKFLKLITAPNDDETFKFVFYPFFSSIGELVQDLSNIVHRLNTNMKFESYPVPRIMTPKGWRFSFPPKHFNLLTKGGNEKALIIDDGSCSGDTLMQLIDSISFLELKEIYVLVILSRLEDYQSEFYTKIKSVQVTKNIINIHIYFGTQFHIPVYHKLNNPALLELQEYDKFLGFFNKEEIEVPGFVMNYIDYRKSYLENVLPPNYTNQNDLLKNVDKREMFLIRDFLGRYDSYRLFKEDEPSSETPNPVNEKLFYNSNKTSMTLLAVILHEPNLIKTVKRINPDIIYYLVDFIEKQISSEIFFDFNNLYFFIAGLFIIKQEKILTKEVIYKLVIIIDNKMKDAASEPEMKQYNILYGLMSFYLLRNLKDLESNNTDIYHSTRNLIRSIWFELSKNEYPFNKEVSGELKVRRPSYNQVFRILYDYCIPHIDFTKHDSSISPFLRVKKYYSKLSIEGINHKDLTDYNNFEKVTEQLTAFINTPSTVEERKAFLEDFTEYEEEVNKNLLNDLYWIFNKFLNFRKVRGSITFSNGRRIFYT